MNLDLTFITEGLQKVFPFLQQDYVLLGFMILLNIGLFAVMVFQWLFIIAPFDENTYKSE